MRYACNMAPSSLLVFTCVYITIIARCLSINSDIFNEELLIKPLPSGHVYTFFQFPIRWNVNLDENDALSHFRLFPRSIGQIITKHRVQELHLSLTQGRWRHKKWGYPLKDAPPGAELWAWFRPDTLDVTKAWTELTNSLSGQFCASLNFIDATSTISPKISFRPLGLVDEKYGTNSSYIRFASLPKETVCTENLSPWRKLLPCDTKAGLSTLLNAINILNSNYFSIAVDFRVVCRDKKCINTALELLFTLSVVFNPPITQQGKQDWSFLKLFGAALPSLCPLAVNTTVFVDISSNKTGIPFTLSPDPSEIVKSSKGIVTQYYAVYHIKELLAFLPHVNIAANYEKSHIYWPPTLPIIHATRFITGFGVERGGIQCHIYNNHQTQPVKIIYLEIIPWYLRVYSHTLEVKSREKSVLKEFQYYQPGRDREHSHHLEMVFTLLPKSVTKISFEFERAFLKWTEYPPDANHGFYVGSSIISTIVQHSANYSYIPSVYQPIQTQDTRHTFLRLYTESLLISLPTPDFSMPYNVICLACTVVALAFGPIHNITTKRISIMKQKKETLIMKIKKKIFGGSNSCDAKESSESKKEK